MKPLFFFSFFMLMAFLLCSLEKVEFPDFEYKELAIEEFRSLGYYDQVLDLLEAEDRIDTTDAAFIKMVSSNSFVAFEQTPDSIVAENGKLQAEDVKFVLKTTCQNKEMILIITGHKGYCHAFKYLPQENQLSRFHNIGSVVMRNFDQIKLKGGACSGFTFTAANDHMSPGDWIRYFYLDIEANSFAHTENCRTIHQKRECKQVENFMLNDRK